MFQFTGFPPAGLCVHPAVMQHYLHCVSTFGHLRIVAHLQLPAAFRSLSRPSSALDAKASSICFSLLDPKDLLLRLIVFLCFPTRSHTLSCMLPFVVFTCLYAVFKVHMGCPILCVIHTWWAQVDSNHRPHAYQACALTG